MVSSDHQSTENEINHTNWIEYKDKSTQTEPWRVSKSPQSVAQSSDSLPELPNYEISQIISDAIDQLPPGSLMSLEESMFAPGSKRNLEHKAAQKTKMVSPTTSPNRKANVSGSSESQSKPLIGPTLYARAPRSVRKEIDTEDGKGRVHTYSPAPGLVLRYESIEKPALSRYDPKVAENPRVPSWNDPSSLHGAVNTKISSQDRQLPPHLRAARQSSEPVKSEKASTVEPIEVSSSKASHPDSPTRPEITLHKTSAINSVEAEQEISSSSRSLTTTSTFKSAVEPIILDSESSSSPRLIDENQPFKSSRTAKQLPPHLRSSEKLTSHEKTSFDAPQDSFIVTNTATKPYESSSLPLSDKDIVAPHRQGTASTSQRTLPARETDFKPKDSSPSSSARKLASQARSEDIATRQSEAEINPNIKSDDSNPWLSFGNSQGVSKGSKIPSNVDVGPNLDDALYFKAWPKSEARDTPGLFSSVLMSVVTGADIFIAAEIRKVLIKNLPLNATTSFVVSIVFGGGLERIDVKSGKAHVLFLHAKNCQIFYDATANGLDYEFEGQKGLAQVEKALDVDVLSSQVRTFIQLGFTRCVRAKDISSDLTAAKIRAKAAYKNRLVEEVIVGKNESGVSISLLQVYCNLSIRFCC